MILALAGPKTPQLMSFESPRLLWLTSKRTHEIAAMKEREPIGTVIMLHPLLEQLDFFRELRLPAPCFPGLQCGSACRCDKDNGARNSARIARACARTRTRNNGKWRTELLVLLRTQRQERGTVCLVTLEVCMLSEERRRSVSDRWRQVNLDRPTWLQSQSVRVAEGCSAPS